MYPIKTKISACCGTAQGGLVFFEYYEAPNTYNISEWTKTWIPLLELKQIKLSHTFLTLKQIQIILTLLRYKYSSISDPIWQSQLETAQEQDDNLLAGPGS